MRKKNRLCKECGKKFKDHPVEGCSWKPRKLWSDKFKPHKPFLEVINEQA